MRPIRKIAVLPTLFTLGNLVCGFFAIVVASKVVKPLEAVSNPADMEHLMLSGCLIFIAMIFDALDGYVARLSGTASDFGAQLDSLCDAVTFGVAPGFLLVKMCPQFAFMHNRAVWIIAASFAACAVLRLARFNVETSDDDDHLTFSGLPSPAAAAAIASFAIIFDTLRAEECTLVFAEVLDRALQNILPFFAVAVALLMVSRIPYPHVVNQIFRGQKSFGHVVAVVFALVAVMVVKGYSVPIVCCAFALSGPVRLCWIKVVQKRQREDPIF